MNTKATRKTTQTARKTALPGHHNMTAINTSNPLTKMLNNAFSKLDRDQSGSLNRVEFGSLYEVLKPGIAIDKSGKLLVSEAQEFQRMDHNSEGKVSLRELDTTDVLMPANLTDDSVGAMPQHLKLLDTISAREAASLLSAPDVAADTAANKPTK
jgi:Ca2+-binding EF-hand superfamily protein